MSIDGISIEDCKMRVNTRNSPPWPISCRMTKQATITIFPSLGNRPSHCLAHPHEHPHSRVTVSRYVVLLGTVVTSARARRAISRPRPPRLGNQCVKFNRRRGWICRLPFLGGGAFHSPASNLDARATRNLRLLDRYAHQQAYTRYTNTAADHAPSLHPIVRITPIHTRMRTP